MSEPLKDDWKRNDQVGPEDLNATADAVNEVVEDNADDVEQADLAAVLAPIQADLADDLEKTDLQARVFVQQADPETTHASYTGPAIWYVTDGSGHVIGKKVRV